MNYFRSLLPFLMTLSVGSALGQSTGQPDTSARFARDVPAAKLPYKFEPIVIQQSVSPSGVFNSNMMFLADQLDRNLISDVRNKPTILASIVSLENLSESSELGRLIREHLTHELQLRNWNISDIRLNRDVVVNDSGEFALGRDVKKLRDNMTASSVVTGTYTNSPDGIIVNIRILDFQTGQLISTAQTRLIKDKFTSSLIGKSKPMTLVKISP